MPYAGEESAMLQTGNAKLKVYIYIYIYRKLDSLPIKRRHIFRQGQLF